MRIEDDGRGGDIVPGNGLCGMRERIESLGGRLRVEAQPGRGTRVEVTFPLLAISAEQTVSNAALRSGENEDPKFA